MKILYILGVLMLIGIMLIVICSLKVLNDLNAAKLSSSRYRFQRQPRFPKTKTAAIKPRMQPYVIGTYLGLTFFVVGSLGSIFVVLQSMNRRF